MRRIILLILVCIVAEVAGQEKYDFIGNAQSMRVGAYYYPEQWPREQWDRDLQHMADLGFEFTHYAEFAWSLLEPEDGIFDFEWLHQAIDIAASKGIKVIMCTQSCTPPAWLVQKHPEIMLKDAEYRLKEHGTRANMSFASDTFRYYVGRITEKVAREFGNHPNVIGWQLHNEPYGHHDYSESAQQRFREWLRAKYRSVENLNREWGTAFWSQSYNNFEQIRIPNDNYTGWGINPHQRQDYKRYTADEVAGMLDYQARILKQHIDPSQWITTNYISHIEGADPGRTTELDFSSFTCYLVYGETYPGEFGFRTGWRQGIDFGTALHKPIGGVTGIMELQPGQVNWGQINPQVLPGCVRMWLWNAYAAGNNYVCNYRFRQPLSGSEQFHHGILKTDGTNLSQGGREYVQFINELNAMKKLEDFDTEPPRHLRAKKTAILWTQDNRWDLNGQKQTKKWNSMDHMMKYFDILRGMGVSADLISAEADLTAYNYLIVPAYQMVDHALVKKWEEFARKGGHVIMSCRTGMKRTNGFFWEGKWAAPVSDLIGCEIEMFDLLPASISGEVEFREKKYSWEVWADVLRPSGDVSVLATYADQFYKGSAAVVSRTLGSGSITYLGVDSEKGALEKEVVSSLYQQTSGIEYELPDGVYLHWRNGLYIAVNYSSHVYTLPLSENAEILIGESELAPAGVTVWSAKSEASEHHSPESNDHPFRK